MCHYPFPCTPHTNPTQPWTSLPHPPTTSTCSTYSASSHHIHCPTSSHNSTLPTPSHHLNLHILLPHHSQSYSHPNSSPHHLHPHLQSSYTLIKSTPNPTSYPVPLPPPSPHILTHTLFQSSLIPLLPLSLPYPPMLTPSEKLPVLCNCLENVCAAKKI